MSLNLTNMLQNIQNALNFWTGPTASKQSGVVLQDSATVTWAQDGYGNIVATAAAALPTASAAGQVPTSSGAGTTYTAQTPAFNLIQTQILGSAAATVTFSSIPQTYKHLRLVASFTIPSGANLQLNFNGDTTTAHYGYGLVYVSATSAVATANDSTTSILVGGPSGAVTLDIPAYTSSANGVSVVGTFASVTIGSTNLAGTTGGLWTGTDVTSIALTDTAGHNISAGSVFSLYGSN